jgi:hypothetical protein
MDIHVVKKDETLSSIARTYGFDDWRTIYYHEGNNAFRLKRPDPDVIFPGDELFIPDAAEQFRKFSFHVESIDTVIGIQRRLNQAGFDAGPEDDINGPQTEAAVMRFQQFCKDNSNKGDPRIIDSGPVDGIAGPMTKKALVRYYGV